MNHTAFSNKTTRLLGLVMLIVMFAASASTAWAAAETLYASNLRSKGVKELKITTLTILYMDSDLSLTKITGDYDLSVEQKGDYTLTVTNTDGTAIDVSAFYCNANLTVKSLKAEKGIEADYIRFWGGTVNLTGDKNVVYAYKYFTVAEQCKSLTVRNYKNDYSSVYSEGGVSISAPYVYITGKKDAVRAYDDLLLSGEGEMTFIAAANNGAGLHSYNGKVEADSCNVTATGGMAIRAEKTISMKGTLKATGISLDYPAILSDKGSIVIHGDAIVNGGKRAIECDYDNDNGIEYGYLTVYGNLTASNTKADYYCILARQINFGQGTITINSTSDAIHVAGTRHWNSIYLNGVNLTATSKESGSTALYSGNTIGISDSYVKATGGTAIRTVYEMTVYNSSVFAKALQTGNFAIKSPEPQYGSRRWKMDVCRIMTPKKYKLDSKTITIYDENNNPADYVVILPNTFTGEVNLNNYNPHPGDTVRFELSGSIKDLFENGYEDEGGYISWWITEWVGRPGSPYIAIFAKENKELVVGEGDVGKEIYVTCYPSNRDEMLGWYSIRSSMATVTKRTCTTAVVKPSLSYDNGKILVNNPQAAQEYIIFNTKKEISSLTEDDWANAVTYDGSNPLYLNGTPNMVNYVYTRVKETPSTLAGTDIASSEIYNGEIAYLQGIKLTCQKITILTLNAREKIIVSDLPEESGAYYCQIGDVIQVKASPIPDNATNFNGISASNWYNNTSSGRFFADAKCTISLDASKQYKTVYFVPTEARNYIDIGAYYTKGYNDIAQDKFYLHVADASGHHLVDHVDYISINTTSGTLMEGIEIATRPGKAWIGGLSAKLTVGEGTAPAITFNANDTTMTVDATNATAGTYRYDIVKVVRNGKKEVLTVVGSISVTVTTPELTQIIVSPNTITADPGTETELLVELNPSNSAATVSWTSSDESIATVTADGVVRIADDAPIGGKATITASSGEISGTCEVTVSGEAYELWIAGTQVTSRNKDDVLGDGTVRFDGVTLTLDNADIITEEYFTNGIEHYLDYLIISLNGENKVESKTYSGMLIGGNTLITGEGSLDVKGGSYGIQVGCDEAPGPYYLTIDNTTMNVEGVYSGFYGAKEVGTNSLEFNNSNVSAKSQNHSGIWFFSGDIVLTDCEIIEPAKATYDTGTVMNGESEAKTVIISTATSHLKGDVNEDGKVDISDIVAIINQIAGTATYRYADVNEDDKVDISDIVAVINIIAAL